MSEEMTEGQKRFEEYWAEQMAGPEYRHIYEEEARKKELWLQLVEAQLKDKEARNGRDYTG